jgi:hypothetical protein
MKAQKMMKFPPPLKRDERDAKLNAMSMWHKIVQKYHNCGRRKNH